MVLGVPSGKDAGRRSGHVAAGGVCRSVEVGAFGRTIRVAAAEWMWWHGRKEAAQLKQATAVLPPGGPCPLVHPLTGRPRNCVA